MAMMTTTPRAKRWFDVEKMLLLELCDLAAGVPDACADKVAGLEDELARIDIVGEDADEVGSDATDETESAVLLGSGEDTEDDAELDAAAVLEGDGLAVLEISGVAEELLLD